MATSLDLFGQLSNAKLEGVADVNLRQNARETRDYRRKTYQTVATPYLRLVKTAEGQQKFYEIWPERHERRTNSHGCKTS